MKNKKMIAMSARSENSFKRLKTRRKNLSHLVLLVYVREAIFVMAMWNRTRTCVTLNVLLLSDPARWSRVLRHYRASVEGQNAAPKNPVSSPPYIYSTIFLSQSHNYKMSLIFATTYIGFVSLYPFRFWYALRDLSLQEVAVTARSLFVLSRFCLPHFFTRTYSSHLRLVRCGIGVCVLSCSV